jgi:hypothetical protein
VHDGGPLASRETVGERLGGGDDDRAPEPGDRAVARVQEA